MEYLDRLLKWLKTFEHILLTLVSIATITLGLYLKATGNIIQENTDKVAGLNEKYFELESRQVSTALLVTIYDKVKDAVIAKDSLEARLAYELVNELLADNQQLRDRFNVILANNFETIETVKKNDALEETKFENLQTETKKEIKAGKFRIDIFQLAVYPKESEPRAEKIKLLLEAKFKDYEIRIRDLPNSVNARNDYRIDHNQIRHDASEEIIAKEISSIINDALVFENEPIVTRKIEYNTPNYLSIFVRNM